MTSQELRGAAKFDHFEQFWLLTNYLVEIATDPQVSIPCSGRASLENLPGVTGDVCSDPINDSKVGRASAERVVAEGIPFLLKEGGGCL